MWGHRKRAPSEDRETEKLDTEGTDWTVKEAASTVPVEVLDTLFEFLDGNGLLSCEAVSYRWRCATDRTSLWKQATIAAFPHLADFQSPYVSCGAYEGDWRETFLDGNRGNRCAVLDWKMEGVAGGNGNGGDGAPDDDSDESQRRFFPPFSLCGYSFSLLADPKGNPRATNQAPAGAPRVEKGLSVYLTVLFQDDPPDTPPWGGGGAAPNHGYPPPPLQLGPGHPWGPEEEEGEEEEVGEEEAVYQGRERPGVADVEQGGGSALPANGDDASAGGVGGGSVSSADADADADTDSAAVGDAQAKYAARGTGKAAATTATAATAAATAAVVRRDPHGLRRRSRCARAREGRAPVVSHVGDASAIARECCAGFSLTAVNRDSRKDIMWVSSMKRDRFFPGRSSWGVHCLVPTSTLQDPEEGFLQDGAATVRLRVHLLFLTAHVYTTADLAAHRGFGVVPIRGNDQPFHFHGEKPEQRQECSRNMPGNPAANSKHAANRNSPPVGGPLPCLTFEVLRCTTLEEMERLVARTLKVDAREIRLWVITQHLTDVPLAPRKLLSEENLSPRVFDDGQSSPSLFRLLSGDTVDETCRVRLWVQQRSDGGFWEAEATGPPLPTCPEEDIDPQQQQQQQQQKAEKVTMLSSSNGDASGGQSGSCPFRSNLTPRVNFGGVKLSRVSHLRIEQMQMLSMFTWGSGNRGSASAPPGQASGGNGEVEPAAAAPADGENVGSDSASGMGTSNSNGDPAGLLPEKLMLVFLKTLGLGIAQEEESGAAAGAGEVSASMRARLARKDTAKDGNISGGGDGGGGGTGVTSGWTALPTYLTHVVLRESSPLRSLFELAAECLQDGTSPDELEVYIEDLPWAWQGAALKDSNGSPATRLSGETQARAGDGAQNRRKSQACRRFLACPPPAVAGMSATKQPEKNKPSSPTLTLEEAGLLSGTSVCFFRAGQEAGVRKTYGGIVEDLVEDMRLVLRRQGALGRVHLIKLAEVVEICESLGYQGFRARIAHDQQRHVNPRETLEYVAKGKHLAFICDSCGTQDFTGPRYHCLSCPDYDLCEKCNAKREPVPPHRYLFEQGQWRREGGFHGHADDHQLEEIFPVPADGLDKSYDILWTQGVERHALASMAAIWPSRRAGGSNMSGASNGIFQFAGWLLVMQHFMLHLVPT
eukprot:g18477.t1